MSRKLGLILALVVGMSSFAFAQSGGNFNNNSNSGTSAGDTHVNRPHRQSKVRHSRKHKSGGGGSMNSNTGDNMNSGTGGNTNSGTGSTGNSNNMNR